MKSKLFLCLLLTCSLEAAGPGKTVPHSHYFRFQELPKMAGEEHFQAGMKAFEKESFEEAINHLKVVRLNFPNSSYGPEAIYHLGVSYYKVGDLELANNAFSDYLKVLITPKYFQQAIDYKFSIAERLKDGEKKRILGAKVLPKWFSGKSLAVEIYDEVIAALPSHEYAAAGLYAKGVLLWEMKEFRESVESFQMLIKRFPRHELAPEAYLAITKVYLEQAQTEFQNPDLITFGEINLRKFSLDFPRESRISEMRKDVEQIKEVYAKGLYETGQYYERVAKTEASLFCYRNAREKFPDTQIAKKCEERIADLDAKLKKQAKNKRVKSSQKIT